MQVEITTKHATAFGSFADQASTLAMRLEGRKTWLAHNRLKFEASQYNLSLLLSLWPSAEIIDLRNNATEAFEEGSSATGDPEPQFRVECFDFQLENFHKFKNKPQWAIFSVQGTGKTKTALDIISHRWLKGTISGVMLFSSPKGVHAQWIEEQLPKHLWSSVAQESYIWDGKKPPQWLGKPTDKLQITSGNIDMLKSEKGRDLLAQHARTHRGKLMIIVDEADSIKNKSAQRSIRLREIAALTPQRAIMTGTPIAKDLTDEWSEFYFLDPNIIGHKYLTSFRAQYCEMGGFEGREVIGHRNVEHFKKIVAPYIFRATKADLNLPPKIFDEVIFDLDKEQKEHIRNIRTQFFSQLESGDAVSVKNGATAINKIQQISNGFVKSEDGTIISMKVNPRLDALVTLRRSIQGKVIIWCRYQEDVQRVLAKFPNAVTIYGLDSGADRKRSKTEFIEGDKSELIATAGAAGKGVDGLQKVCSDAIYYSNSYNAIDRWQSEDRIDRIGSLGAASYFDLIARGSVDRPILSNLKRKKGISDLALGDIIKIMEAL